MENNRLHIVRQARDATCYKRLVLRGGMRPVKSAQDGAVEIVQALAATLPVSERGGLKVGRTGGVKGNVWLCSQFARKEPVNGGRDEFKVL